MAGRETVGGAAADFADRLGELLARHRVPGATLGILRDGEISAVGAGVLSTATGVDVTADSVFQIGSITKVWTATLVMQAVDEGLLELDQPVVELDGFRVADADVTRTVTMRHLLTHTSGIDGDVFTDTGRGDDCLERYVTGLAEVEQNHPLGATWSYCNSGYVLAGRIVEHLTRSTWDAALRELLVEPLGLTATVTLPEDALLHRTAVGHVSGEGQGTTPCPPRRGCCRAPLGLQGSSPRASRTCSPSPACTSPAASPRAGSACSRLQSPPR